MADPKPYAPQQAPDRMFCTVVLRMLPGTSQHLPYRPEEQSIYVCGKPVPCAAHPQQDKPVCRCWKHGSHFYGQASCPAHRDYPPVMPGSEAS